MNVKEIVSEYLKTNKFDGLVWSGDLCGCLLEDLAPCGQISDDCEAGHRQNIDASADCDCGACGKAHWHIVATQPISDESCTDAKAASESGLTSPAPGYATAPEPSLIVKISREVH